MIGDIVSVDYPLAGVNAGGGQNRVFSDLNVALIALLASSRVLDDQGLAEKQGPAERERQLVPVLLGIAGELICCLNRIKVVVLIGNVTLVRLEEPAEGLLDLSNHLCPLSDEIVHGVSCLRLCSLELVEIELTGLVGARIIACALFATAVELEVVEVLAG